MASLTDFLLGLASAPGGEAAGNRFVVEGLTFKTRSDGALEIGIRKFEAAALCIASGPLLLEVGQISLHDLVAVVLTGGQGPRLASLEAANAELSDVKVHAPLALLHAPDRAAGASAASTAGPWSLAPLAGADGVINAEIVDATLLFDATVKVPIRGGRVDFNEATVEHVGPDSRMGVSRLGLYVDAPNGRSYLYQFASAPVGGVEYEQRSLLPGPWGTRRGSLDLQPFGEALARQQKHGPASGLTEQARLLFERTAVSGHVQLGDGKFAGLGVEADLEGRAAGRNLVRLRSKAVGRGIEVDVESLSIRRASWSAGDQRVTCEQVAGAIVLQLLVEGTQLRGVVQVARMKLSGVRLQLASPGSAPGRDDGYSAAAPGP